MKIFGPIRHCEPPHAHSPGVAVARRLRIDVHDDNDDNANDNNDNACQRGPLWPLRMGPNIGHDVYCVDRPDVLKQGTD